MLKTPRNEGKVGGLIFSEKKYNFTMRKVVRENGRCREKVVGKMGEKVAEGDTIYFEGG